MSTFNAVKRWPLRGLLRIWCLLSFAWAVAVALQVIWPWQLSPVAVAERHALKQADTSTLMAEAETEARRVCPLGPISVKRETTPPIRVIGSDDRIYFSDAGRALRRAEAAGLAIQDRLLPEQRSLETAQIMARMAGRPNEIDMSQVQKVRVRDVPATITVIASCIPDAEKTKSMMSALTAILGPPLVIPLLALLMIGVKGTIFRWLKAGFETAEPLASPTGVADGAELAPNPASIPARTVKALGWSVVALTIIDIFLRGALSFGKASGTNILIFVLLAIAALISGTVLSSAASVPPQRSSQIVLWGGGLITIAISLAPYL